MSVAIDKKDIQNFSNEVKQVRATYDFANDGGLVSTIELMEAKQDMVIYEAYTAVKTAATSGGAATVEIGTTADPNQILASTAVASLTLNAVFDGEAASARARVAAGQKVNMIIGTAALTAGKIEVVLLVNKY